MFVSIGILAWNEEKNIRKTLVSLFNQSVFSKENGISTQYDWEIVVVPNGCKDSTASTASEVLQEWASGLSEITVNCKVVEIEQAGKSNAWNRYVHDFSNQSADFLILIDADIEFGNPRTIENVLATINSTPAADAVVDLPLKDLVKNKPKNPVEWFSLKFSSISLDGPPGICGQFYCARGNTLRNIWMPVGLSNEDGFLKAMIVTDLFRSEVDNAKVVRAHDADHFYEAESSIAGIFKHQLRLVIGTSLNCFLTWDALLFMTDPEGPGAGELIRNRIKNDPDWYRKYLRNVVLNKGWWVLPRGMLFGRFYSLKKSSGIKKINKAFVLTVSLLFDLPVFILANKKIKSGQAIGYW